VAVNNANKSDMKSVSNISVKSVEATGTTSRTRLDEFVTLKESMDMMGVMRETLECIVRYSTRPNDENSVNDPRAEPAALIHNLARAASIIDAMRRLDEHDQMHCVDAKLVESVLNLDYVVDEFRSYLR
jgi:beta-xylosidase